MWEVHLSLLSHDFDNFVREYSEGPHANWADTNNERADWTNNQNAKLRLLADLFAMNPERFFFAEAFVRTPYSRAECSAILTAYDRSIAVQAFGPHILRRQFSLKHRCLAFLSMWVSKVCSA
jgi:hypothetical protein